MALMETAPVNRPIPRQQQRLAAQTTSNPTYSERYDEYRQGGFDAFFALDSIVRYVGQRR
jgi:hypothetical protein